jgi:hypothetical protein
MTIQKMTCLRRRRNRADRVRRLATAVTTACGSGAGVLITRSVSGDVSTRND